jgi:hypothetical protein
MARGDLAIYEGEMGYMGMGYMVALDKNSFSTLVGYLFV